jgi:acid phosphatase type 7
MKQYLLALTFVCTAILASAQAVVTVGPYLQSPTPGGIKIKWWSDVAATSKIMYGTNPSNLTQTVTDASAVTKHTVELTGLAPATRYYYAVYNDNTFAEGGDSLHTFRTFPVAETQEHVRAWVIGDFGKGNVRQQLVRDSYTGFDNEETDLWLWLGDNVYDEGLESEYLSKVFDSVWGYKELMKRQPFLPCPGNHDYATISPVQSPTPPASHTGPYYDFVDVYQNGEAGGTASGHELFYSYDYGNTHFISLNSELGSLFNGSDDWIGIYLFGSFSGSPMTQWLHQDLTANTKPWVVVYFHQPPYTDGSHDAGSFWEVYMQAMRENFAEIWEQYGVDLVLCGHSHVYERSFLVKGAYGDASQITPANILQGWSGADSIGEAYTKYTQGPGANEGTVYVVQGNSASVDDAPGFTHPYMFAEYGCDTCAGSFVLDIDSNRLDGRHLDAEGNIRDHFTILKTFGPVGAAQAQYPGGMTVVPNPFGTSTTISFDVPAAGPVSLLLTDVSGKSWTLLNEVLPQGKKSIVLDAQRWNLSAGVYILQLEVGEQSYRRTVSFRK